MFSKNWRTRRRQGCLTGEQDGPFIPGLQPWAQLLTVGRYNVTKLIELLIVRELAEQITKSSKPGRITTSVINPGFVKTEIMRDATFLFKVYVVLLAAAMSRTPEEGGRTLVNAAEGGEETHGQYLDDCKVGTLVRGCLRLMNKH